MRTYDESSINKLYMILRTQAIEKNGFIHIERIYQNFERFKEEAPLQSSKDNKGVK